MTVPRRRGRAWLACAAACAVVSGCAPLGDRRQALLAEGEAALSEGRTGVADARLEQAAQMQHAADTEMAQVRAAMQSGDYRRALAFGAHAAGAHRDSPEAAALYAWLLRAGAQNAVSARTLAEALEAAPRNGVLRATARALEAPFPVAGGELLDEPHRLAPAGWPPAVDRAIPAGARVVGSAVLVDGGETALAPMTIAHAGGAARLWLRNGRGRTTEATLDHAGPATPPGTVRLRLRDALPFVEGDGAVSRLPFAGTPAYVVEYAIDANGTPAWPWLRAGFLGAARRDGARMLGIAADAGHHGGLVLDAHGDACAIAFESGGEVRLAALGPARAAVADPAATPAAATLRTTLGPDAAYERGLRLALQVVVAP